MSVSSLKVIALLLTVSIASMNVYASGTCTKGTNTITNCNTDTAGADCDDSGANALCTKCAPGYIKNAGQTACTECTAANCEECDDEPNASTKCTVCETGYGVKSADDSCEECTVSNCAECAEDSAKCTKCDTDYTLNDGKDECTKDDDDDDTDGAFRLSVISWMTLGVAMIAGINF